MLWLKIVKLTWINEQDFAALFKEGSTVGRVLAGVA